MTSFARYPSLADRTVLVTGGATGIGAALVSHFAAQGAQVGFIDIAREEGAALARELAGSRHPPQFVAADLTDIAALEGAIDAVRERFGPVRVLLNNAANDRRHRIEDTTPEAWDAGMAVNLRHQFFAARSVAADMKQAGGGSIVNFGSISWMLKQGGMPVYTTAKAAVQGLTRSLARELGPFNIRVNTLVPGWVMTERQLRLWVTDASRADIARGQCIDQPLQPEHIAHMALFLAADDSAMCTAQDFVVDGGLGVSEPQLLVDARDRLGECALWCERSGAFYWTDIEGCVLHCLQADGRLRHWKLPERVGSFAFCEDGRRLLLGLASGIALFDTGSEALSPIVPVDGQQASTRINDGRCDRQGRFVFGMYNAAEAPIGRFYRVHADLHIEVLPLPLAAVGNSIAFSPDGATMYYTDSPTRTIWRLDYGADGRLGAPRVFAQLAATEGYADGSCVDAEGGLWNAQWDGGCVVRFDAAGNRTAHFSLPVSRPTCPAFGGAGLDRLYVTSARGGLDKEALRQQPQAGGVFTWQPGWRGLPESRFVLAR